ncbi:MAG: TerB family tellurite resistance protein [Parvularcula sp.]
MKHTNADLVPPGDQRGIDEKHAVAALLLQAVCGAHHATEVERDVVTKVVMKLYRLANPAARALTEEAENLREDGVGPAEVAQVARGMELDAREKLLAQIWRIGAHKDAADELEAFVDLVADCWGMDRSRARSFNQQDTSNEEGEE